MWARTSKAGYTITPEELNIHLGAMSTRLSIIDLKGRAQPIGNKDDSLHIRDEA